MAVFEGRCVSQTSWQTAKTATPSTPGASTAVSQRSTMTSPLGDQHAQPFGDREDGGGLRFPEERSLQAQQQEAPPRTPTVGDLLLLEAVAAAAEQAAVPQPLEASLPWQMRTPERPTTAK